MGGCLRLLRFNKMKNTLTITLLFIGLNAFAQKECNYSILDNNNKNRIPFAIIQYDSTGFYTDSLGKFSIDKEKLLSKSIKISCLGYESKQIVVTNDCNVSIYLEPVTFKLPTFTVSSKPPKTVKLGIVKKTSISASILSGEIIATFIPNESNTQKIVKKIVFPYRSHKDDKKLITSCFRFHLFSVGSSKSPEMDLIEQNLVFYPEKLRGKIEIDVRKYNIVIPPEGIFVGVEWVAAENAKVSKYGYKFSNDLGAYISDKSIDKYPTWEKTFRNEKRWQIFVRPKGVRMSAHIGLEVEER